MTKGTHFQEWVDKAAWGLLAGFMLGVIAVGGYLFSEVQNKVDKSSIHDLPYPYAKEKAAVEQMLETLDKRTEVLERKVSDHWSKVVTNNTIAVSELKVEMSNSKQQRADIKRVLEKLESKLDGKQ